MCYQFRVVFCCTRCNRSAHHGWGRLRWRGVAQECGLPCVAIELRPFVLDVPLEECHYCVSGVDWIDN